MINRVGTVSVFVTDMAKTYADLKLKGVKFTQEPDVQPWGTFATIQDSEGNDLLMVQQPEGEG